MIAVLMFLGVLLVGALALAGKYKMEKIDSEEHNEYLKEEIEATNVVLAERDMKIHSLVDFFNNGVFYDVENDTVVLAENLERIGEL